MERKILFVEDDPFHIDWVERFVLEKLQGSVSLSVVHSEREFLIRLPDLRRSSLCGFIIDATLPWEDGVLPDSKAFPDERGSYFEAGIRILGDIKQRHDLVALPILFYSVNEKAAMDLPSGLRLTYMRKDAPDEKLLAWLRSCLC